MTRSISTALALAALSCLGASAQQLTIKGVLSNNRYDDGDQLKSQYIGSLVDADGNYILDDKGNVRTAFIVDQGIYKMTWDGQTLTTPAKDPAVNMSDIRQNGQVDLDKAIWATNFNLMVGNSGAAYVDGQITTVMSRDYQSTTDEELFAVRKWDAATGNLLSPADDYYPASANLESAGMAYNPVDGKTYGLFYLTAQALSDEITSDPDFFTDQDGEASAEDAGYCICTIDLATMKLTPVTPGLYYYNFVTFAINSEGRAFAMTSGGTNGVLNAEGKVENINGELTGAQLCEFDLQTGLMLTVPVETTDPETGEAYTANVNKYPHGTGYCSQYRRQSACFSKDNPNKMYWNGYYNSGKGVNENGSWTSLSDRDWRTNGKYDTCLYEVDINTGDATRLAKIGNRCTFACMWVEGSDASDGTNAGVKSVGTATAGAAQVYSLAGVRQQGSRAAAARPGLYVVKQGDSVRKVVVK